MAETAQTMTEFTYAPGEKNIIGDRFSPSVVIFWLKTSVAASSTRVQYKAPNTLFGLIPLGERPPRPFRCATSPASTQTRDSTSEASCGV